MKPVGWGLLAGIAAGGAVAYASRGPTLVHWPDKVRTAFPFVLGGLVGATTATKVGVSVSVLRAATGRGPGPVTTITPVVVGSAALAGAVVAGRIASHRLLGKLTQTGRDLDDGFAIPPSTSDVTAGPGSLLTVDELGREGARFVGTVTSPDDVRQVTGRDPIARPIRVFVGFDSAATVEQRVGLAMAELRRTGAFDRGHLLIQAPAGTGYANPTPVDVLEVLTEGDCASVAIGYGLLPSFLSLNKVEIAGRTQKLLLDSIHAELQAMPRRPRLLLYGESLGAKVQQAAMPFGPADLDFYGIDGALYVGTPGSKAADDFHLLCSGESIVIDRPALIPAGLAAPAIGTADEVTPRPRVWFLEHDGDPVVRFRPEVLWSRPDWLPTDGTRGRNVPESMSWRPGITWAQALVDTLFATDVKPGDFQSMGHDYRADLGGTVPAAYRLEADTGTLARLEDFLRAKEIARAAQISS